jgi:hypothetical protein
MERKPATLRLTSIAAVRQDVNFHGTLVNDGPKRLYHASNVTATSASSGHGAAGGLAPTLEGLRGRRPPPRGGAGGL